MKGELQGMAATGKHATWSGYDIFRVAGGKIADIWALGDIPSMMQQLGVSPPTG